MSGSPGPATLALPTLRSRLLRHVLLPLGLTWLAGAAVSISLARHFTQAAYDRSLLDDAYSVASNVRANDAGLELMLSSREVRAVLFDQVESVYFAVRRPDGSLLAGHAGLDMPPSSDTDEAVYGFADIYYQGRPLRAVRLRRSEPLAFEVIMAQTTQSRSALLRNLLLYSVIPEVLLLVLLAAWLGRAIRAELQPLARLQQALGQRNAQDLTPLQVQANTRDVHLLEDALNALLARVARGVQAQREFAGNVAHELRTPLAGIRALAEYGLAQREPEAWRMQLQRIVGSEARASHLVDQLLALALADEARTQMQAVPVALDELVRDAVLRLLPRADAAGIDLGGRGLDEPLRVMGHPTLLEGILNNLLDNALRYGRPASGEGGSITVELQRLADGVHLSVIDNGPGIPGAERERILQRWVQGEEREWMGEGVGLGMAIVSRYAQLLGARFELGRGPEGQGLKAGIVLPAELLIEPGAPF
ncbi:MAG: sensor histidine kinase [Curvibacter sp.]|nr:MAG: sensor histidine kinase [Curvibacter sp.]